MARLLSLDLCLLRAGYLRLPDGSKYRHIIGLDTIARDITRIGADISWADIPGDRPARCHVESKHILLAPWVFWAAPAYVRRVLTEELAHCVVGHSEERAQVYQEHHYGQMILPAWAS